MAPAYNEEACIAPFVEELFRVLSGRNRTFEVLCVDDGSSDATLAHLRSLKRRFHGLRVASLPAREGQSAALAAGVSLARGRYVVLMDADLQNDPTDVWPLVDLLEGNRAYAAAVGVRHQRRDNWLRRISSIIGNWVSARITGEDTLDAGCGLRAFRAEAIKRVSFFRGAHRFLTVLSRARKQLVLEVPVKHRARPYGHSKYGTGLGRAIPAFVDAFGVRWLRTRTINIECTEL